MHGSSKVFSLTPFKYLFHIPTRPLVIFNYKVCEVVFYDDDFAS